MSRYLKYKGFLYKSVDSNEADRFRDKQVQKLLEEGFSHAMAAHTKFKKVIEFTGDRSYLHEVDEFLRLARDLYRNKL